MKPQRPRKGAVVASATGAFFLFPPSGLCIEILHVSRTQNFLLEVKKD